MHIIVKPLIFYGRLGLAWVWFFITCLIGLGLLIFRWKDTNLNAVFGRILYWGSSRILRMNVIIENRARLYIHQPCIYVANHQSNLDIHTMSILYPYRSVLIGKKELRWIPLFGLFFAGAGNILINRQDRKNSLKGLEFARNEILSKQLSVWIFPEGTRNHGSAQMLPFKKGAFHLALAAQVPIIPIIHQPLKTYYDPSSYKLSCEHIVIRVLEPVPTTGMKAEDLARLMDQVRQRMEMALTEISASTKIGVI